MRKIRSAAAVAVLLVVVACGGGVSQPAGSTKVTMSEYKFDPSNISVKSGKVTFFLVNQGSLQHDMVVQDKSGATVGKSDLLGAGDQSVFTIDNLPAGQYTFFCDVPGHRQSGMQGTLSAT